MRKRIYEIIEISQNGDKISAVYDYVMMATILTSLIPLGFKQSVHVFNLIEKCAVSIFIATICILPSFSVLSSGFRVLKLFRLMRTFRVFRAFKMLRYSKSISIIANLIRDQKDPLIAVGTLALGYI